MPKEKPHTVVLQCPKCGPITRFRRVTETNEKMEWNPKTGTLTARSSFDTITAIECLNCDTDLGEDALDNFQR